MGQILGIDVGGTFTDLYTLDSDSNDVIAKAPSTPHDPVVGIMEVIRESGLDLGGLSDVIHGSTIATNAVIERKMPRTALVTTRGFRDLIEIGRYHRRELYNPYQTKPEPLVLRRDRFEVPERIDCDGNIIETLNTDVARQVALNIAEHGIRNVAVGLMNAYANPEHERQTADILREVDNDLNISLSSSVLPRIRPLGRFITTILNASLRPLIADYVTRLEAELADAGFSGRLWLVRSNGGIARAAEAIEECEALLNSGPAAGVVGTSELCEDLGISNGITMDMGGTSCDISLVENATPTTTNEAEIDWDMPVPVPMVDLTAIGAGGGSLAWVDNHGILKVGPRSAGADPGPIFYDRGNTQPTVSDANLILGYLNPEKLFSGSHKANMEAVHEAMLALGERLGFKDPVRVAKGIVAIANQNMANAISQNLIKRGRDPRRFALVAFGGAGPLHASNVAKRLSIPKAVLPRRSSVFSAYAGTLLDARHEYQSTYLKDVKEIEAPELDSIFQDMENEGRKILGREGFGHVEIKRYAELRYEGQSYELEVEVPQRIVDTGAVADSFIREHERIFGIAIPENPISLVNLRSSLIGKVEEPDISRNGYKQAEVRDMSAIHIGEREVFFLEKAESIAVPVFDGESLLEGDNIDGPALVDFNTTTVVIEPEMRAEVDAGGNVIVHTHGAE